MMMINPLNQELFDLVAIEMTYLKLFDHIFNDFVTRKDILDMLFPNNLAVQVAFPAGTGGVISAVVDPGKGPTVGALALKQQKALQKSVTDVNPSKFLE